MYKNARIAAVIPAYNEQDHIGQVLSTLPDFVDCAVVVDDGSTDRTAEVASGFVSDRVTVLSEIANAGVGASRKRGILKVLDDDCADVIVTIDGDGQMDVEHLPDLLDKVVDGDCEFAKGNRFFSSRSFEGMPRHRLLGNIMLTFMTKLATGYWSIFDPQNGYTAMRTETARKIDWENVSLGYAYENDILARLGILRARVKDVDIPAKYGSERSSIRLPKVVPAILGVLWHAFWRRFWLQYVLRSFSPVAIFVFFGMPLMLFALTFGTWVVVEAIGPPQVTAANAVLVALSFLAGFQLLLAALVIDVINEPR